MYTYILVNLCLTLKWLWRLRFSVRGNNFSSRKPAALLKNAALKTRQTQSAGVLLVKRRVTSGRWWALCSSRDSRLLTSNQIIKWQHTERLHPPRRGPAAPDWLISRTPRPVLRWNLIGRALQSVSPGGSDPFLPDILTPRRDESSGRWRRRGALRLYPALTLPPAPPHWRKIWKCRIGGTFAVAFITHLCHYQRTLISIWQEIIQIHFSFLDYL